MMTTPIEQTGYEQGEFVVVFLPYKQPVPDEDADDSATVGQLVGKRRPVLIVSATSHHDKDDDLTVAQLTSKISKAASRGEYVLGRWKEAGLDRPTAIRPKLYVIRKSEVIDRLGIIHQEDRQGMIDTLRHLFDL